MFKRFTVAVIAALALIGGVAATASAGPVNVGATDGEYTTEQDCGSHHSRYHYTVVPYGANKKQLDLAWAEYWGPGTTGVGTPSTRKWAPMVTNNSANSSWLSLSGKGFTATIADSVPAATSGSPYRITKGDANAVGWGRVILNYASSDTSGRQVRLNMGTYSGSICSSSNFDLTSNVAPPPPTDISGSFSMDWHCFSPANTAFESYWTWYYTITGSNPNWTLTTTGLTKNYETTGAATDLSFGSNPHIVNGDIITFTWASGAKPTAAIVADWSGGISCSIGPVDLIANF